MKMYEEIVACWCPGHIINAFLKYIYLVDGSRQVNLKHGGLEYDELSSGSIEEV